MNATPVTDSASPVLDQARGGPAADIVAALVRASVGFLGSTALLVLCMVALAAR